MECYYCSYFITPISAVGSFNMFSILLFKVVLYFYLFLYVNSIAYYYWELVHGKDITEF